MAVVLALPLLIPVPGLSPRQYGVLAGPTVYAVPQVLAATVALDSPNMQTGTLVKLLRVLMLGSLVLLLSLAMRQRRPGDAGTAAARDGACRGSSPASCRWLR
ncbi:putative sulfate exporter family transporter [Dankookia sp. P2]|uniref:putative sulfate exporter family transporter n=1 Tax=Dankookia sp. P2 TaxID=3423955 RepID=UPI003D672A69